MSENTALHEVILDWVAISPDGLTLSHLVALLRPHVLRRLVTSDVRKMLKPLLESKAIQIPGRVYMPERDAELRTRALIQQGRYLQRESEVAAQDRFKRNHWGLQCSGGVRLRELRRAMLSHEDECVHELREHIDLPTWSWFASPLDSRQISRLSPALAAWVLDQLSQLSFTHARPVPELHSLILQQRDAQPHPLLHTAAAREALFRGLDDPSISGEAAGVELSGYLQGMRALVIDLDPKRAVKAYAPALTKDRKLLRTTKLVPGEPAAIFLPLAYLLEGSATRVKQALSLIQLAESEGVSQRTSPWSGWQHLPSLVRPSATSTRACEHPVGLLLQVLCGQWTETTVPHDRVNAQIAKAEAAGWSWLATALAQARDGEGLVALRQVLPAWRTSLDAIAAALGGSELAPKPQAPHRIKWTLYTYGTEIELAAREQIRQRSGWSKGKPIAASRLCGARLPAMTDTDAAIVSCVRETTYRNHRGYPETEYEWPADEVWPLLVRHPALFDSDDRPLSVVSVPPRLELKQVSGGQQLTVRPDASGRRLKIAKLGNGFEVTIFDVRQLRVAQLIGEGLLVPSSGAPRLAAVMALAKDVFAIAPSRQGVAQRAGDPSVVVLLQPSKRSFLATLRVEPAGADGPRFVPGEGSELILATVDGVGVRFRRDLGAEREHEDALLGLPGLISATPEGDGFKLPSPAEVLELLCALREHGVRVYWPQGQTIRLRAEVGSGALKLRVKQVRQWFQPSGELQVDEQQVLSLGRLLKAVSGSASRFIELDDGSFVALERQLQRQLQALARTAQTRGKQLAVHPLVTEPLVALAAGTKLGRAFDQHLARLQALPESVPLPSGLDATLRDYQASAFQWLVRLAQLGAGGLLADDMGLGKTMVALALLLHRRAEGPALVVAPTSVAGNWRIEATRFAPSLVVHPLHEARDRTAVVKGARAGEVVLCSYGLLVSEAELLASCKWATLIFDESQALKNPSTQRHKAAAGLSAGLRVALTGTPIENHLGELHAHFELLNPGMLGTPTSFRRRFQRPIEDGDPVVRRQLRELVRPFLLRRTKAQVLEELPARTDIYLPVALGPQEAALYEAERRDALATLEGRKETDSALAVLAQLTRLRLLACSPRLVLPDFEGPGAKLQAFAELAHNLVSNGHRALVFSQFVKHLKLIRAWLDQAGLSYQYLTGATPARARDTAVQAFQLGDDPFFLISTRAGGQGLNLTAADYVIHMDPWWNPAVEDQASDRAHRMGQRRPVTVYRLYAEGTVEEHILALHHTKRSMAEGLLEGADTASRLSAADLLALLRGQVD